jgi:hypothetical protein
MTNMIPGDWSPPFTMSQIRTFKAISSGNWALLAFAKVFSVPSAMSEHSQYMRVNYPGP